MQYQEFAERHPFQVVDAAGEQQARFSNCATAMAYAKAAAEEHRQDFEVYLHGVRVGRAPARITASMTQSS